MMDSVLYSHIIGGGGPLLGGLEVVEPFVADSLPLITFMPAEK